MSDINKTIGKNLLLLRKNKKLTQMELAENFNYSDKTISKWEAGDSLPSVDVLYNLAQFYSVSLNDLTDENFNINEIEEKPKRIRDRFLPAKLIITLLAVSAVWMCATIIFVTLQWTTKINYPMVFLWAVPASCILLIIFNSIWGKAALLFPILTVMLWSIIVGVYLQLVHYNIWMVYLLGIPIQVAIILWSALVNKPKKKEKRVKEKSIKLKKQKNLSFEDKGNVVSIDNSNEKVSTPTAIELDKDNTTEVDKQQVKKLKNTKNQTVREDDGFEYDFFSGKKDIK